MAGGSTFKEISGTTIKNLDIIIPPLKEQQKIVEILSSLDEKIELNIKMNKTLEEMEKTILKDGLLIMDELTDIIFKQAVELYRDYPLTP